MGFKKMFKAAPAPATVVSTPPPTVSETVDSDTQADYAQRSAHKRGLLSTILSNRNGSAASGGGASGANKTLG